MKRRRLVTGLGSACLGAGLLTSSGAFTSTQAERTAEVRASPDSEALLELEVRSGPRAFQRNDNLLEFQLPGGPVETAQGVGTDSVYHFGREFQNDKKGMFTAKNRGDEPIRLYSEQDQAKGEPEVNIYDVTTGDILDSVENSSQLDVGEKREMGLVIDTAGVDTNETFTFTITLIAEATDSN